MATKAISDATFEEEVLKSDKPVLVDFWAEWCGPCKMIGSVLEEISDETDAVKIVKLDVDANPNTAAQFRVMSIPTLIMFKNGEPTAIKTGALPKGEMSKWINEAA